MILTKIKIHQYKGINDEKEIAIDDFNLIVGQNDAGKSTILKSLDSFLNSNNPSLDDLNVKLYGQFSADCIKEGEVKPGMAGTAVLKILGTPNSINQTETENMITEQLVYDKVNVYLENSIVTAIQRHIGIK
jgi:AAA15 family ATPase/GTPase